MRYLDGVYVEHPAGAVRFRAPSSASWRNASHSASPAITACPHPTVRTAHWSPGFGGARAGQTLPGLMRAPAERRAAMRWPQRLKRVFGIDVEICAPCGDTMRIIACIEDPMAIKAILAHLAGKARPVHAQIGRASCRERV